MGGAVCKGVKVESLNKGKDEFNLQYNMEEAEFI